MHLASEALDLLLELKHALHPGQVHPQLGRHLLDAAQPLHVLVRIQAGPLGGALGLDQAPRLVHAERLGVHVGQLGGHGDHEHAAPGRDLDARRGSTFAPGGHQLASAPARPVAANSPDRGLPFMT